MRKRIFKQQPPTSESDGNETFDSEPTNEITQELFILTNQQKDWQSRQNNIIVHNISESDLVKNNSIAVN